MHQELELSKQQHMQNYSGSTVGTVAPARGTASSGIIVKLPYTLPHSL
jgi:hypothetical protein